MHASYMPHITYCDSGDQSLETFARLAMHINLGEFNHLILKESIQMYACSIFSITNASHLYALSTVLVFLLKMWKILVRADESQELMHTQSRHYHACIQFEANYKCCCILKYHQCLGAVPLEPSAVIMKIEFPSEKSWLWVGISHVFCFQ